MKIISFISAMLMALYGSMAAAQPMARGDIPPPPRPDARSASQSATKRNACLLVRGLRAVSDFEYEFQMACMNSKLAPEIETIFLTASDSKHYVSSRFVKQIARLGGDVSEFVSPSVQRALLDHFKKPKESI